MPELTTVSTVRLPVKLYRWAKERAKADGRTFSNYVRVTLEALKHDEEQAKRISKIKQLEV